MPCHYGTGRRSAKKLPPARRVDPVLRTTVSVGTAVLECPAGLTLGSLIGSRFLLLLR